MRKYGKLLVGLMSLCMVFQTGSLNVRAAEQAGNTYHYTLTFYAGSQGGFSGTDFVTVESVGATSKPSVNLERRNEENIIKVSGLAAGDRVAFDAARTGAVNLKAGSKYYVKGIRESGKDYNEEEREQGKEQMAAITVDHDQDCVVAYGVRGSMTTYTVNYQDTSGRTLEESRTYSGNVGDRPVVAYVYIPGYQPQAYNLTRTLVQNAAENVFTFVYTRVRTPSNPSGGGSGSGGSGSGDGGGGGTAAPAPTPAETTAPGGTITPAPAGGGAAVVPGNEAGDTTPAGGDAGNMEVPDEGVPQSEPQELVDLDDEEVPLAGIGETLQDEGVRITSGAIVITIAAMAAFIFLIFWARKRAKAKADEE